MWEDEAMQWFRLYNETRTDPKLRRLARTMQQPMATALGTWVTVLCMAGESPARGRLLLSEDVPVEPADLEDATGLDNGARWLAEMETLGMLRRGMDDGVLEVVHWGSRQYESDDSTSRVRAFRQRSRGDAVTPGSRYSNSSDTEADAEAEADTEAEADANGVVMGELRALGIPDTQGASIVAKVGAAEAQRWVEYVKEAPGLKNPAAYLISQARTGAKAPAVPKKRAGGASRESSYADLPAIRALEDKMRADPDLCKRILRAPVTDLERKAAKSWRDWEAEQRAIDKEAHEAYQRMQKDPAYVEQLRGDDLIGFGERAALERWDKLHGRQEGEGVAL